MKLNIAPLIYAAKRIERNRRFVSVDFSGALVTYAGDVLDTFVRRYCNTRNGYTKIYGVWEGVKVMAFLEEKKVTSAAPPSECYRIHLCTPDLEGEAI